MTIFLQKHVHSPRVHIFVKCGVSIEIFNGFMV